MLCQNYRQQVAKFGLLLLTFGGGSHAGTVAKQCVKLLSSASQPGDNSGYYLTNRNLDDVLEDIFGEGGEDYWRKPFYQFNDPRSFVAYLKNERAKVLDVGCGRGRTVLDLLKRGVDAYGIDAQAGMDDGEDWQLGRMLGLHAEFGDWQKANGLPVRFGAFSGQEFADAMNNVRKWETQQESGKEPKIRLTRDRDLWVQWKLFKATLPKGYFIPPKVPSNRLITGDAYHMPYENNAFDFAYSHLSVLSGFYQSTDRLKLELKEVLRVVRPGGLIFCGTWGDDQIREIVKAYRNKIRLVAQSKSGFVVLEKK